MTARSLDSKLPNQGLSIFAIMSQMAQECEAINLSQGFPDFESDPVLIDLVHKYMRQGKNQYAPMPGLPELRQRISGKVESLYGQKIDWQDEITITSGATQALFNTFNAFVKRGDEVIILDPAYDSYAPAVHLAGGKVRPVAITGPDFRTPWDKIAETINEKTALIVLTNPHNPLGKILTDDDIGLMRKLLEQYNGYFVVDEVYEHLVYDDRPHLSILRYPELYARSVLTYSFGKTFHNTGWKIGYSIAPPQLTKEIRKVHQFNVFSVNTPIQYALAEYMEDEKRYLGLSDFFEEKRDYLSDALSGTALKPLACEGSYFMLVDYSEVSDKDDRSFAEWLTREYGVATIPLSPFYSNPPGDKVVRLCFAKELDTLERAVERLKVL